MDVDAKVLEVLEGQSPDYLIHPGATAFVLEGLDEATALESLNRLAGAGHAREEEVVVQRMQENPETGEEVMVDDVDDDGNPVLLDSGWTITDTGREHHGRANS